MSKQHKNFDEPYRPGKAVADRQKQVNHINESLFKKAKKLGIENTSNEKVKGFLVDSVFPVEVDEWAVVDSAMSMAAMMERQEQRLQLQKLFRIPVSWRVNYTNWDVAQRSFADLEQEFAGLMETHERIMNHFK